MRGPERERSPGGDPFSNPFFLEGNILSVDPFKNNTENPFFLEGNILSVDPFKNNTLPPTRQRERMGLRRRGWSARTRTGAIAGRRSIL